jgi:hypothetical protein
MSVGRITYILRSSSALPCRREQLPQESCRAERSALEKAGKVGQRMAEASGINPQITPEVLKEEVKEMAAEVTEEVKEATAGMVETLRPTTKRRAWYYWTS